MKVHAFLCLGFLLKWAHALTAEWHHTQTWYLIQWVWGSFALHPPLCYIKLWDSHLYLSYTHRVVYCKGCQCYCHSPLCYSLFRPMHWQTCMQISFTFLEIRVAPHSASSNVMLSDRSGNIQFMQHKDLWRKVVEPR